MEKKKRGQSREKRGEEEGEVDEKREKLEARRFEESLQL